MKRLEKDTALSLEKLELLGTDSLTTQDRKSISNMVDRSSTGLFSFLKAADGQNMK